MTDSVRLGLLAAYRKLLQPLVRILIRSGISFGEVAEVLKTVFVEVAARDFDLPDRKTSLFAYCDPDWADPKGSR